MALSRAGALGVGAAGRAPASTSSDGEAVRVVVRARPMVPHEKAAKAKSCVRVTPDGCTVVGARRRRAAVAARALGRRRSRCVAVGSDRAFTFDAAFNTSSLQEQVYEDCVAPLVESCFGGARRDGGVSSRSASRAPASAAADGRCSTGYNVTLLAYGQTGSGKARAARCLPVRPR